MKLWKPLLVILPAGLVAGLVGARLVDPRTTVSSEVNAAVQADADRRAVMNYRPQPRDLAPSEDFAQPARQRPDLDWEEEVWPEDYAGGIYDYYDGSGSDPVGRWSEDAYRSPDPYANAEAAEEAALAAERAMQDVARAEARAAEPIPEPQERAPTPAPPPEPRTADGDLPAIW